VVGETSSHYRVTAELGAGGMSETSGSIWTLDDVD
jgi:hypothetical protein